MTFWAAGTIAATIGGSLIGANASRSAANKQAESAEAAIEAQRPFLEGGYAANNRLLELLGISPNREAAGYGSLNREFGPADLTRGMDPGYGFRMKEGMKALNATAAARGGLVSGNALRAAQDYGQNLASTEFTNAFNRYQANRANILNPLQSLSGQGQTTANAVGNIGMGGANAQASGIIGSANAISGGLNQGVSLYNQNQLMNRIFPLNAPVNAANTYGPGSTATIPQVTNYSDLGG